MVLLSQGERSSPGTMSVGSLGPSSRRGSRGSLRSSRSSLRRSSESLPATRSATADAIFMEEFGEGKTEAAAPRECKCVTLIN